VSTYGRRDGVNVLKDRVRFLCTTFCPHYDESNGHVTDDVTRLCLPIPNWLRTHTSLLQTKQLFWKIEKQQIWYKTNFSLSYC